MPRTAGQPEAPLRGCPLEGKDPETGKDVHLTGSDLDLSVKRDIDLMKEIRSWKGERHARGLKVRGQRTKTTARRGRSIGVSKKRV